MAGFGDIVNKAKGVAGDAAAKAKVAAGDASAKAKETLEKNSDKIDGAIDATAKGIKKVAPDSVETKIDSAAQKAKDTL